MWQERRAKKERQEGKEWYKSNACQTRRLDFTLL